MSYTRTQWSTQVLVDLGNTTPDPYTIAFVDAWTALETTAGQGAHYNLLNTEQREPGSTSFNSVGVQNFTSFAQGCQANATVISNGRYPTLHEALRMNQLPHVPMGSGAALAIDRELAVWTGSSAYNMTDILALMGHHGNDTFPGEVSGPVSTPPIQPVSNFTYVVQPGDSLSAIAAKLKLVGGWQALYHANQPVIGNDPNLIHPGQVLSYQGLSSGGYAIDDHPQAHLYTVQSGDNLSAIATKEHIASGWTAIYARNRGVIGSDPNLIHPGQVLDLTGLV